MFSLYVFPYFQGFLHILHFGFQKYANSTTVKRAKKISVFERLFQKTKLTLVAKCTQKGSWKKTKSLGT
jgi:hypothetical protein